MHAGLNCNLIIGIAVNMELSYILYSQKVPKAI